MDKYELKPYELSRVRYYDGEYLKDDEFIDEQRYHIDRRQRHDRLLHVTGVADGMELAVGNSTTLVVRAGTAIDDLGQPILVDADRSIAITAGTTGTLLVQIEFREKVDRPANPNDAVASNTRFTQDPLITVSATQRAHAVVLGRATITNGLLSTVTNEGRVYSGIRLPSAGATSFSLRARSDATRTADLNCSLSVTGTVESDLLRVRTDATVVGNTTLQGNLTLQGTASFARTLSVTGNTTLQGALTVQGTSSIMGSAEFRGPLNTIPTGNLGIGTETPKGRIHAVGDVVLGLDQNNRKFVVHSRTATNGDYLHITHDDVNGNWEWTHGLVLDRVGRVGIGTATPVRTLHVNGNAHFSQGAIMNLINVGINGLQTSYSYPYESLGTDDPGANLRLCSRAGIYLHAPRGVYVSRAAEGGDGNFFVDNNFGVGTTNPKARGHVAGDFVLGEDVNNRKFIFHTRVGSPANGDFMLITHDKPDGTWEWTHGIGVYRNGIMEIRGNFVNNSTRENKENIEMFSDEEALAALQMLEPKKYNLRSDEAKTVQVGFIAEETPDLVATLDYKGIRPHNIIAILTKIVKKQQRTIEELERRLDEGLPSTS
ncbi:MAG TPA: tail fiber domain-containing protein [Polyangium sp.]|nr:tail fiber domain-containing protein [Polyangium sp.]